MVRLWWCQHQNLVWFSWYDRHPFQLWHQRAKKQKIQSWLRLFSIFKYFLTSLGIVTCVVVLLGDIPLPWLFPPMFRLPPPPPPPPIIGPWLIRAVLPFIGPPPQPLFLWFSKGPPPFIPLGGPLKFPRDGGGGPPKPRSWNLCKKINSKYFCLNIWTNMTLYVYCFLKSAWQI